ncbi:MAG: hypothetical protein LBG45_06660 [Dysgonamonadaceae bacterium]|jgi:hypothetical protein|nr:hypothetical protein [Dysgonamonadaceae bacterium]
MSTAELSTSKMDLIRNIIDETDADCVMDVAAYMYLVKTTKHPCFFSDTEKCDRIAQSVSDAGAGLGVTEETMFSRHPEWI